MRRGVVGSYAEGSGDAAAPAPAAKVARAPPRYGCSKGGCQMEARVSLLCALSELNP